MRVREERETDLCHFVHAASNEGSPASLVTEVGGRER